MRTAIIAVVFSVIAIGLASFATFTALNENDTVETVPTESGWSAAECERALKALGEEKAGIGTLRRACAFEGDCAPYNDMLQAIADNCP